MAPAAHEMLTKAAARESYGRLVALVAATTGDIGAAEDALGDAFSAALSQWTRDGVPDQPDAWLLKVARRRAVDTVRRRSVEIRHAPEIARLADQSLTEHSMPDKRLRLMYACAHPGIDAPVRAPLMLQTILGLSAQQIGAAFLVSPSAMGARLSRAKRKIRDVGVPLDTSPEAMSPERLAIVCEAVYAAFSTGYSDNNPAARSGLSREAIWLGRLLHQQTTGEPEITGLLSLMLFIDARTGARRSDGRYVPLDQQDPARWHNDMIREANRLLVEASRQGRAGRFQLEAAIQSAHAARAVTGSVDWPAIVQLYEELLCIAPTLGARIAHVAAIAEINGAEAALEELDAISTMADVSSYQPYWAVRAQLERRTGVGCGTSVTKAAALTEDEAVRRYLFALVPDANPATGDTQRLLGGE